MNQEKILIAREDLPLFGKRNLHIDIVADNYSVFEEYIEVLKNFFQA